MSSLQNSTVTAKTCTFARWKVMHEQFDSSQLSRSGCSREGSLDGWLHVPGEIRESLSSRSNNCADTGDSSQPPLRISFHRTHLFVNVIATDVRRSPRNDGETLQNPTPLRTVRRRHTSHRGRVDSAVCRSRIRRRIPCQSPSKPKSETTTTHPASIFVLGLCLVSLACKKQNDI